MYLSCISIFEQAKYENHDILKLLTYFGLKCATIQANNQLEEKLIIQWRPFLDWIVIIIKIYEHLQLTITHQTKEKGQNRR